jgi:hypothetical protein
MHMSGAMSGRCEPWPDFDDEARERAKATAQGKGKTPKDEGLRAIFAVGVWKERQCPQREVYEHYAVPRSTFTDWAKTLKGDEEPWVDDVDDYLESLEAEEGQLSAVSSRRLDRVEETQKRLQERMHDVEQEVRSLKHSQWGSRNVDAGSGFGDGDSGSGGFGREGASGNGDHGFNGAAPHDGNSKGGAGCSGFGGGGGMALSLAQLSPSSTLVDLKQFIDVHNLPVKKNVGGKLSRTRADIYHELVTAVNAMSSGQATPNSPMPNGQATPRTVEKPRNRQAMHIPHSAASQPSEIRPHQSHNSEISITVTADSKVVELKRFIDVHSLPVKKNTGGLNSRTKADMYHDIVRAVHARSSASSLRAARAA